MSDNHPQLLGLTDNVSKEPTSDRNSPCTAAAAAGDVDHVTDLSSHIGSLYLNNDYSDITLVVDDASFPAHRVILAARSEYFRALLFGGLRETSETEVQLVDTTVVSFRALLMYIYTGKVTLIGSTEDLVLDILGLAHKYGFVPLEQTVSNYLQTIVTADNLCIIYDAAHLYSLSSLNDFCLQFADHHADDILASHCLTRLSNAALQLLIARDSFCAKEIDIFVAVRRWLGCHPLVEQGPILARLRLSLIKLDDLLNVVRPSDLVPSDAILDAIKEQTEQRNVDLAFRGFLCTERLVHDVNVATVDRNAIVREGELRAALLNGDHKNYDMERGFTRHPIEDRNPGIVVELGMQCIINHIRLLLWDKDARSYSYFVEVSMDNEDWARVVDHSMYMCRSQQNLYFAARVVRFVRVVGTHNTLNRVFHLVSLEAFYVSSPFQLDVQTSMLVPNWNVATVHNGSASVIEGVSRSRNALLNGDTSHYDWDSGYTCHQLGSGAIVVQLSQPFVIDSMRSWQLLTFEKRPITFVRIVGTYNSANEVFHCVHFECPAVIANMQKMSSNNNNNNNNSNNGDDGIPMQRQQGLMVD